MATVSMAEVAQACGVSVSVLHRWRKQFSGDREVAAGNIDEKAGDRRIFSKEFKESVVHRLESGESVNDLVNAFQLNPTVVRRWWHEWRKYGEAAFSGYGKTRSPAASTRMVVVRFTAECCRRGRRPLSGKSRRGCGRSPPPCGRPSRLPRVSGPSNTALRCAERLRGCRTPATPPLPCRSLRRIPLRCTRGMRSW
jgi:transposase-like protein